MQHFYLRAAGVFRKSLTELYAVPCDIIEWAQYLYEIRPAPAIPQAGLPAPGSQVADDEEDLYGKMPTEVTIKPQTPYRQKLTDLGLRIWLEYGILCGLGI